VLLRRPREIPEAANHTPGRNSLSTHDERLASEFGMPTAHHTERSAMQAPEDPTHPDVSPFANNRRTRLLAAAGAVVAVAAIAGIAYAVSSTRPEVEVSELALAGGRSLGSPGPVRGHLKNQACGPKWSQHRQIEIASYFRGAAHAA
jgi:hypothetical protein